MPGTIHDDGFCGVSAWIAQILLNGVPQHPAYALLLSATFMTTDAEYRRTHLPRIAVHFRSWGVS